MKLNISTIPMLTSLQLILYLGHGTVQEQTEVFSFHPTPSINVKDLQQGS